MFIAALVFGIGAVLVLVLGTGSAREVESDDRYTMYPADEPRRPDKFTRNESHPLPKRASVTTPAAPAMPTPEYTPFADKAELGKESVSEGRGPLYSNGDFAREDAAGTFNPTEASNRYHRNMPNQVTAA